MAKAKKKGKEKKHNRLFGVTSRVLMLIVAALLALSYVSIVINPAKVWPVSLSGILFVPLMTLNIILLLWAVKRLSGSFVIPLLALIPSFFFIGRYVQLGTDDEGGAGPEDRTVKVMTWNVGRFALQDEESGIMNMEQCADSIFDFILAQDPDIVCLQEFKIRNEQKVREYLQSRMKGYAVEYYMFPSAGGSFGNVTLSRLPVRDKGKIKFDQSANLAIYTDHEVGDRQFRVYNCHFESYNISFTGFAKAVLQRDNDIINETGTKVKRSITRRPKQVDQVFSHIENCPVESFVCGDFNDNPMSYTYYRMTRDREDSFVEAGRGFGATYALLWPMLRIDYILYPSRYDAVTNEIPRVELSDHYPVISEIEL